MKEPKNVYLNPSGLTSSNYSELSHVYEKYKTQGKAPVTEIPIIYYLVEFPPQKFPFEGPLEESF